MGLNVLVTLIVTFPTSSCWALHAYGQDRNSDYFQISVGLCPEKGISIFKDLITGKEGAKNQN